MDFKERLKELRIGRGLSQRELGKRLGMTNSAISMYERGEREPDYETLEKIADLFNVDIAYLLGKEIGSFYYLDPDIADVATRLSEDDELFNIVSRLLHGSKEQRDKFIAMAKLMEI